MNFGFDQAQSNVGFEKKITNCLANELWDNALFLAKQYHGLSRTAVSAQLLGRCYLRLHRFQSAIGVLESFDDPESRYLYAKACLSANKLHDAEQALSYNGVCPVRIKINVKDKKRKATPMFKGVEFDIVPDAVVPGGAFGYYLLGEVYKRLGVWKKASACYHACLTLEPSMWCAYQALVDGGEEVDFPQLPPPGPDDDDHGPPRAGRRGVATETDTPMTFRTDDTQSTTKPASAMQTPTVGLTAERTPTLGFSTTAFFQTPSLLPSHVLQQRQQQHQQQQRMAHEHQHHEQQQFDAPPAPGKPGKQSGRKTRQSSKSSSPDSTAMPPPPAPSLHSKQQHQHQQHQQQKQRLTQPTHPQPFFKHRPGGASSNAGPSQVGSVQPVSRAEWAPVHEYLDSLAQAYVALGHHRCRVAVAMFGQLSEQHADHPWILVQLGRAHFELSDYQRSASLLGRAASVAPWSVEGMDVFSTALWHLKRDTELSFLAQRLSEQDRLVPETWIAVGNSFALAQEHEAALKFFRRAIQVDPLCAYAHTLAGHECNALDMPTQSLECYRSALRIDPRHYKAWYGLGLVYHRLQKFNNAEKHFSRACSIHPESSVLYCQLGIICSLNKKYTQALSYFDYAIDINNENTLARFKRAHLMHKTGNDKDAVTELEQLVAMVPREGAVYFLLGRVHWKLGHWIKARSHLTMAMDLDSKNAAYIRQALDALEVRENYDGLTFEELPVSGESKA